MTQVYCPAAIVTVLCKGRSATDPREKMYCQKMVIMSQHKHIVTVLPLVNGLLSYHVQLVDTKHIQDMQWDEDKLWKIIQNSKKQYTFPWTDTEIHRMQEHCVYLEEWLYDSRQLDLSGCHTFRQITDPPVETDALHQQLIRKLVLERQEAANVGCHTDTLELFDELIREIATKLTLDLDDDHRLTMCQKHDVLVVGEIDKLDINAGHGCTITFEGNVKSAWLRTGDGGSVDLANVSSAVVMQGAGASMIVTGCSGTFSCEQGHASHCTNHGPDEDE